MAGLTIAFQNYQPFLGIGRSTFVGLDHFIRIFSVPWFEKIFTNTLIFAVLNLVFYFPIPILLAIMINEVKNNALKRSVQTMIYVPHFVSWVVVVSIGYTFFTTENGVFNNLIVALGGTEQPFLVSNEWFRWVTLIEIVWKEAGWGTIIFLSALTAVDKQLYESAAIDGANRFQKIVHITIPAIQGTIITMLLLRIGRFMDTGYEQIYLMLNALNRDAGEVFDTYVYTTGIVQGQYSFSAAIGMFKSMIGLILLVGANIAVKKAGKDGLY